jgi:D-serine deaminase-like pyridoxal phosphate-dependent protein
MQISDYFHFEDVGRHIEDLETPVPLIDIGIVENNLKRWQTRCDKAGFANRPHIKTHKLVGFAKRQLHLGAKGITVQKLGEAEVMADAGITDMLITFNIVGTVKLKRLSALMRRTDIVAVADNEDVVKGLAHAAKKSGRTLSVLVECDTGANRNGVQSPTSAQQLAQTINKTSGLRFGGLMTYARTGGRQQAASFLSESSSLLAKSGLATDVITTGGTPDMWSDEGLECITEYRAGTYIYFDRSLAERGTCAYSDCGLTVLATVVSRPTDDRAIIDAGSKALTSDLLGLEGYGVVQELSNAKVYNVNEEHGYLDIAAVTSKPNVGDLLRVTPNHVCPVTNLFDKVILVDGKTVLGAVRVDARGMVQ